MKERKENIETCTGKKYKTFHILYFQITK